MLNASSNYSAIVEDILRLMWSAEEAGRDSIEPKDVPEHMDVVLSTATENIQRLTRQGLVTHERYGHMRLTPQGRAIALGMARRHRLLETYLHEALGFSWDEVYEEAEILEHVVSDRLLDRLGRVLGYPSRGPYGDPIPRADGSSDDASGSPLDALDVTAGRIVVRLPDHDPGTLRAWKEADLMPGARVAVVTSDAGGMTVLLKDGQMLLLDSAQTSGIVIRGWATPARPRFLLTRPGSNPIRLAESAGRTGNTRRRAHRRGAQSSGESH